MRKNYRFSKRRRRKRFKSSIDYHQTFKRRRVCEEKDRKRKNKEQKKMKKIKNIE